MSLKQSLIRLLIFSIIVACGPRSGDDNIEYDAYENQYLSGNCGEDVLFEYNKVIIECPKNMSRFQAIRCDLNISQFIQKYAGIHCSAHKSMRLDGRTGDLTQGLLYDLQESARVIIDQGVL